MFRSNVTFTVIILILFFKQRHTHAYEDYLNEKNEKNASKRRPKSTTTFADRVITSDTLNIAVTKLIVNKILPVSLADDESFREYSHSK